MSDALQIYMEGVQSDFPELRPVMENINILVERLLQDAYKLGQEDMQVRAMHKCVGESEYPCGCANRIAGLEIEEEE
jgi:hypothetical protein